MLAEVRPPAVAGRFYPADPAALDAEVKLCLDGPTAERLVSTVVAPHAGYMYSGAIAGETYARAVVPDTVVVLCPNHTGAGVRRSASGATAWAIPGGAVPVAVDLRDRLVQGANLRVDDAAHLREHAVEVHLPFLRAKNRRVSVVPICLGPLSREECVALGDDLARVIGDTSPGVKKTLIVASTDMSHYIPADVAKHLDALAIDRILEVDPEGLYDVVTERDISMCGFVPTTVALAASRSLGARACELVRYGNSGETSGDMDRVVGYAGALIS
jgi:AmmeMemoRadiSam system protein B